MHICFQCTLDYSLWTKPKMLFLFWKMLKKTYDSDDLHSEGGTWCSHTPCEHSCSPMQSALNRSQWQACQQSAAPAESLRQQCKLRVASGSVVGTEHTCAVVRWGFWITDRVGVLKLPPDDLGKCSRYDKWWWSVHTHAHTHTLYTHGEMSSKTIHL